MGTLNVRSIRQQEKLEHVLRGCRRRGLAVLLAQETFLGASPDLVVPAPWTLFNAPHPTMGGRRRGLAILVNQQLIEQLGWRATRVAEASTAGHDYLAVRVGPWLMVSVYVPCTDANGQTITRPNYEALAEDLAGLRRDAGDQLLVAGDYNGGGLHGPLNAAMADQLALQPLVKPPLVTRPSQSRPTEGSLLDNIYYPLECEAALELLEPLDSPGDGEPLPAHDSDDDEPPWVQDVSDHLLVAARLPTSGTALVEEAEAQPRPKPERRIRWRKLGELQRAAKRGEEPAKGEAKAKLKAMADRIVAITTTDLAEATDQLLAICREELGTYLPRQGPRHAFMTHPAVKAALRKYRKAKKRFDRARGKDSLAHTVVARLQGLVNAADHEWRRERDEAIRVTAEARMGRVAEGGISNFFRRFQGARGVKRRLDPCRHLDPAATAAFWAAIFSSTGPSIAEREPYAEVDVTITPKMVRAALKEMASACQGPDGLDFGFFRHFANQLADVLARCFTSAIAHGLPDGLRRSLTLLFPKGGKATADPADYRPITLLPMVVRVLHKVLDQLFRSAMGSAPGRPQPPLKLQRTQAAFLPGRNTYEQAALLQLVQSVFKEGSRGSRGRQLLCGIFLDIRKAFDSMDYGQLLDILETRHRLPRSWLEILRRFLPGNSTTIMGVTVFLLRGLQQGGALCPLLCDIYMDDLACELAEYLEQHPRLGPLWRKSTTQDGHNWGLPHVKSLWLRLLQFADDIAILAASAEEAQELLNVVAEWGQRRGLEFSPKSFAVLLSRPMGEPEPMPELRVGELPLTWAPEDQPFRYLGVTTQAATSHTRLDGKTPAALKEAKARRCLNALRPIFRVAKGKHLVAPVALRHGIEQVVYAGALYDTALVDTNYDRLDSMVTSTVAQIMQVPPTTPSAFLRWELRLWHGELRAHKRSLHLAAQLWHQSWIGKDILEHYLHRDHHEPANHPFFKVGPQARLEAILAQYNLDWGKVRTNLEYNDDEQSKARLSDKLADMIQPKFSGRVRDKALETKGMPERHRREMLDHMAVPPPEMVMDELELPAHMRHELPLYLYIGGDLPRAGLWTRMPYLRLQRRGEDSRAACAWCGWPDHEYGHHLLRCKRMPAWLRRRRDRVLGQILADVRRSERPPDQYETATSHANFERLFHLYWPGKGSWLKGSKKGPSRRCDCGRQPDREVLTKALWYMRAMINEYRKATAGTGQAGANPVWELPIYGQDPDPEPEQGSGTATPYDAPPALCDSLWLLDSPEE